MRIRGFGSKTGSGAARAEAFRQKYRIGERLYGRIVQWESPGLAWVDFKGQELLAQIHSRPSPGQTLLFQVLKFYPHIVLQELCPGKSGADPLTAWLQTFWSARAKFETSTVFLREGLARKSIKDPDRRRNEFLRLVGLDPGALALYVRLLNAQQNINTLLKAQGGSRFAYPPWLLPEAHSQEFLVTPPEKDSAEAKGKAPKKGSSKSAGRLVFGFTLKNLGQCELRVLYRSTRENGSQGGYRVLVEHSEFAPVFQKIFGDQVSPGLEIGLEYLGSGPLSSFSQAGVLSEFLLPEHARVSGFVHRV
ncbi:MAG: hypothetical protein SVS15_08640 [Thermodesulfobacteriota bacterium]|nr:hypothetical protein [Thermodesulfobacteriota bacterium]